jgi:hypothetical protein
MATAATSAYCCNTLHHHLPKPTHLRRLPLNIRLDHSPVARFATRSAAARLGPRARASSGPPPPLFETEEEVGEEEEPRWSDAEGELGQDSGEEQEWAGGNGAARGEDLGADAGGDLSGWTRQWPRPRELFVCNLPRRCGVDDLLELFRPHGTVLSVEVRPVLRLRARLQPPRLLFSNRADAYPIFRMIIVLGSPWGFALKCRAYPTRTT